MPGFAGLDISEFPGMPEMVWLIDNTNLQWCGYYLGPAPSHANTSWMGQRVSLKQGGWGTAPVYVGQQLGGPGSHIVTAQQGAIDGTQAVQLMMTEGFAAGSCVYLDLEDGPPFTAPRTNYVAAWVDAVEVGGFLPGIYCSHVFAGDVHTSFPNARLWVFKVSTAQEHPFPGLNFPDLHPAGSGYAGAFIWQLGQNCRLNLPQAPVESLLADLDSSLTNDPGAP